jgi:hypothetical protein
MMPLSEWTVKNSETEGKNLLTRSRGGCTNATIWAGKRQKMRAGAVMYGSSSR